MSGWAMPRRTAVRLVEVLHRLLAAKAQLIGRLEGSGGLAYEVPGGLGAMCITAAEEYVSRFLADSQFGTKSSPANSVQVTFGKALQSTPITSLERAMDIL